MEKNIIYNEDCLIGMDRIEDASISLIYCDLPFGSTHNKWDVIIPFEKLWNQYKRIIKPNGAIVLHATEPFASLLRCSNLDWYRYDWVWNKKRPTGHLNAKRQPLRQHELICVFYKSQCFFNPILHENRLKRSFTGLIEKGDKESNNYGKQYRYNSNISKDSLSYPRSIIEQTSVIGNSREKLAHQTQKPLPLCEYLIKTYTTEGELVLDNCMGSGTTAVACINTNRDFIGFELDKKFFDISIERINSCYASKTKINHERTK